MSSNNKPNNDKKSLKDLAKQKNEENPSQLGDPISLKAETSNTEPTDDDRSNKSNAARATKRIPSDKMKESNPSQLGDPISLRSETSSTEPTEDDRGALGTGKKNGKPKM